MVGNTEARNKTADGPEPSRMTGSPVLLTTFNRIETVRRVLPAIAVARPPRMYLACDGPRPGRDGEADLVAAVRKYLTENITWDCEVKTRFRSENLGCGRAMSDAITWFFKHEESGIILEDDCLPTQEFFAFCDELLIRYRDDQRVMHIGGACLVDFDTRIPSYFFSNYPQVWGWATWRDRWARFSHIPSGGQPPDINEILGVFRTPEERNYWDRLLRRYFAGRIDTWDYSWACAIWKARGMSVYPVASLTSNIGMQANATHTKGWRDYRGLGNRPPGTLGDLVHPEDFEIDRERDRVVFESSYAKPPVAVRVMKAFARLISPLVTPRP